MTDRVILVGIWRREKVELWNLEVDFCFLFINFHLISFHGLAAPYSTSLTSESASIPASGYAPILACPISSSTLLPVAPQNRWSKQIVKNKERSAWTRGRDEWSSAASSNASDLGSAGTRGSGRR